MLGERNNMLRVPSTIAKVETMSDGGLKLIVHTQELVASDKAEVMNLHEKFGWMVFSESLIKEEDIPDEPIEFDGQKSPSQSLRNTLYVYFERQGGKSEDFPMYWHKYCEQKKNEIKRKLDEIQ